MRLLPVRYVVVVALAALLSSVGSHAAIGSAAPESFLAPLATTTDASYNWAGYVADEGYYTAVSGSWTLPEVESDAALAADAAWVGIGGVHSSDLIQAGTQAIVEGGRVRYEAWYERLPEPSRAVPLRVSPGDSVTVSLTEVADDRWYILFINNTTGRQYALTTTYESSHSSAEWIEEMPSLALPRGSQFIPLGDFGRIVFTGGSTLKSGVAQSVAGAGAEPISMHNYAGQALAQPSILGPDGATFSVERTEAEPMSVRRLR